MAVLLTKYRTFVDFRMENECHQTTRLIVHFFLKKSVYSILISRKWMQNDKCFIKSSRNVTASKTNVILYDVAAKICQFDVTSICTNTVRSVLGIFEQKRWVGDSQKSLVNNRPTPVNFVFFSYFFCIDRKSIIK